MSLSHIQFYANLIKDAESLKFVFPQHTQIRNVQNNIVANETRPYLRNLNFPVNLSPGKKIIRENQSASRDSATKIFFPNK